MIDIAFSIFLLSLSMVVLTGCVVYLKQEWKK